MSRLNPFVLFDLRPAPILVRTSGDLVTGQMLKNMYLKMQAACHPDNFAMSSSVEQQAAIVKSADLTSSFKILNDDVLRVKCWLVLQGIDVELTTVQHDMNTFELQMELNEVLSSLTIDDIDAIHCFKKRLSSIHSTAMEWFQVQTTDNLSTDLNQCLRQYAQLAMVSRLFQQLKDLRFVDIQ